MKKIASVFGVLVMLLAFSSCEKALVNDDKGKKEESGNVIVSIYQMEGTPFPALTRAGGTEVCQRLNFAVYDSEGTRLSQVNQKVGDSGFGTASFQLEEGDYQLVVVAHSSSGNPTMTNPAKIQFTNATGYSDTFLHHSTISVGDENQTLNVSLNRIVSLCRVVVTDEIPEGVTSLEFLYTGGSGAFNAATGLGNVNSKQKMTFSVTAGEVDRQFDLYTFLHQQEDNIDLVVTAYGDNVNYKREFDVPMKRNYITWLSGNLFSGASTTGSGEASVTISINSGWDGEEHITF